MLLSDPVSGPGPVHNLGIHNVADLVHHLPRRHEDRRSFRPITSLVEGERAIVHGTVERIRLVRMRGRRTAVDGRVADDSGSIRVRWWNMPWLVSSLPAGTEVVLYGRVKKGEITQPEYEAVRAEDPLNVGRIVPVYPLTKGVNGPALRRAIHQALTEVVETLTDPLPPSILGERGLPPLADALFSIHFPADRDDLARAKRRLGYDEFFYFQLAVAIQRRHARRQPGVAQKWSATLDQRIRARLPFQLTAAQERTVGEIVADLTKPEPMNRLLQGDVGSGKTAVAVFASLVAVANKTQVAFLAPTEVLARQHLATLQHMLKDSDVGLALLVGSTGAAERRQLLRELKLGVVDLIVGTHALLEPAVEFSRLGLVVVDEQHKFGVEQRARLIRKGVRPDVLVMTATPIPRTLALTAFGDLDGSVIDEMPPGRTPSATLVLRRAQGHRAYKRIREEAAAGRQSYVVFPLVAESEEIDAGAAQEGFAELVAGPLKGLRAGLVTGRTPAVEKTATMDAFRAGEIDVLVGTTVLEVGLDVPNATVMVVESAERFGLSTLHQLRGRVGRGTSPSFCFLLASRLTVEAKDRLLVMEATDDGFRIAEEDLRLRGPGEFFGTRQHGMPEFRVADLVRDHAVLVQAREDAFALLARDGRFERHPDLRAELTRRFVGRIGLYEVG